jgi:hypothetical protein
MEYNCITSCKALERTFGKNHIMNFLDISDNDYFISNDYSSDQKTTRSEELAVTPTLLDAMMGDWEADF